MKKFIVMTCLLLWTNISCAQQVTVTGVGDNKDVAIKDAFRNAIEQVVGIYVNSSTVVSNSQVELDKIYANSEGYITDFKVLRTAYKGEGCHVQVLVDVDTEPSSKLLSDLKLTYMLDNPRIMVKVSGGRYAGICEAALVSKLREMGLEVVAAKSSTTNSMQNSTESVVDVNNDMIGMDILSEDAELANQNPQDEATGMDSGIEIYDGQDIEEFSEENSLDTDLSDEGISGENQVAIPDDNYSDMQNNNVSNEVSIINTASNENGSMQALSDWGINELEAGLGDYTVRCIISESSMNVTLPNFYVAGKNTKTTNNATGLYKGIVNANVDVVKNSTKSVVQQFYLTDTKIYNSADIAKQMAAEGISQQIANKVAEIFSHHATLVTVNS
ncbi:MAG: hypothetical protein MSS66_11075 [Selenomonadaceae bacterium]|nr:hypothetical protein [Selenomonadaceae bacterium]